MSLHITETRHDLRFDEWIAYCRCGWTGSYLPTQGAARADGDAHLEKANAVTTAVGDRVRAVHFAPSAVIDDNVTVPPGTEGTVNFIDDTGTVFVKWDNGSGIGLLPGRDEWEVL